VEVLEEIRGSKVLRRMGEWGFMEFAQ